MHEYECMKAWACLPMPALKSMNQATPVPLSWSLGSWSAPVLPYMMRLF